MKIFLIPFVLVVVPCFAQNRVLVNKDLVALKKDFDSYELKLNDGDLLFIKFTETSGDVMVIRLFKDGAVVYQNITSTLDVYFDDLKAGTYELRISSSLAGWRYYKLKVEAVPPLKRQSDFIVWRHRDGYFKKVDGNLWEEHRIGLAQPFIFKEVDKTEGVVILYDNTRDFYIKLNEKECTGKNGAGTYQMLYAGSWE